MGEEQLDDYDRDIAREEIGHLSDDERKRLAELAAADAKREGVTGGF